MNTHRDGAPINEQKCWQCGTTLQPPIREMLPSGAIQWVPVCLPCLESMDPGSYLVWPALKPVLFGSAELSHDVKGADHAHKYAGPVHDE
jgi:hypothetical protein